MMRNKKHQNDGFIEVVVNALLSMQRLLDPSDGKIYTMTAFDEVQGIGLSCVSHPRDTVMWVKSIDTFKVI